MAQRTNQLMNQRTQFDNIGKIPPQAIELEEAILGAIMLEKEAIYKALNILTPESFYKDAHQKIFAAMVCLSSKGNPIDILSVTEELKKQKTLEDTGGAYYVANLTTMVASASNIEFHSHVVNEKYKMREIIRICSESIDKAFDDSFEFDDIILNHDSQIVRLTENITGNCDKIINVVSEKLKEIEKIQTGETKLSGIPSGLTKIDSRTCGWQNQDFIVIGARPSVGKTAIALKFAKSASLSGNPTIMFSLEMSKGQLSVRVISSESGYTQMELKTGRFDDWTKIDKNLNRIEKMELYVDDTAILTISKLKSLAYNYHKKFGIKLIIVDYLQLIKGDIKGQVREQEISNISRTLKIIAKELNIPVIALAQLGRQVESRSDKKPMLSDLRESGSIEQDADMVIFIRRDEMYFNEPELKNKMQIDIAKYRNGAVGEIQVSYNEGMTEFKDEENEFNSYVDEYYNPNARIGPNNKF